MFVNIAQVAITGILSFVGACQTIAEKTPEPATTWAFCGVDPYSANAEKAVHAMAFDAGIDATFGECNNPGEGYSPAYTGTRYSDP